MSRAVWSLEALAEGGRDVEAVAGRLRYTAPIDMSGHPTLTLPGGMTRHGVPAGFQIAARAFDEGAILAAGHAYQQATDWHLKRSSLLRRSSEKTLCSRWTLNLLSIIVNESPWGRWAGAVGA